MRLNNNYLTGTDRYFTDFISPLSRNKKSLEVFSHKHNRVIGNYKPIQMDQTTNHPMLIAIITLYSKYDELRKLMPPFFIGYQPTSKENRQIEAAIFKLSNEFASPMLQVLKNINANDFVYMLSGFKDLNQMPAFKQEIDSYYRNRLTPPRYNVLVEMAASTAILRISPSIYLNRLQKSLDYLTTVLEDFKASTQNRQQYSTLTFSKENTILAIANQLLELDYVMTGLWDAPSNKTSPSLVPMPSLMLNPFDIMVSDPQNSFIMSQSNVNSSFVAFVRDIQKFGARFKQYQAICNSLGSAYQQNELIQAEMDFLSILQLDNQLHDYLGQDANQRFQLRPIPVAVEPYRDYVIPYPHLKLIYRYNESKDISKDQETAISCFKEALGILEAQRIDPLIYDSLNSITIINVAQYSRALPYNQSVAGLYNPLDKNLSIIFHDFPYDSYYPVGGSLAASISRQEYLRLPPDQQKGYSRLNVHVILHELGHHIYMSLMSPKARAAWEQGAWVYNPNTAEFDMIDDPAEHVTSYSTSSIDEDFAETFAVVMLGLQQRRNMACTKRLVASLQQAVADGLSFHERGYEDIDELIRMIDTNLAVYIDLKTIRLPHLFAFVRAASSQPNVFMFSEHTAPTLVFKSSNLPLVGSQNLIGEITIDSSFFYKNKFAIQQIKEMLSVIMKAIFEAFASQMGIDAAIQLMLDNNIPVDTSNTSSVIIENAVDNYIVPDILTWRKKATAPYPEYRELISKILLDLSIIKKY